jgi:hypothetical protein
MPSVTGILHLGERLTLPPWLEPQRPLIDLRLPPLARGTALRSLETP